MKKSLLSLLLLCVGVAFSQAQSIKLPSECKKILNRNFSGWKFAQVSKEVGESYKKRNFPFEPNLLKGDWNGDGKIDYAVLIERRKKTKTVAFIRLQTKYKQYNLEGGDYIQIFRKGQKDYDYDSQKDFTYKNDSIFVGIGCCGSSYIWKKNKFIGFVTSD